jgi:hypothetical protein
MCVKGSNIALNQAENASSPCLQRITDLPRRLRSVTASPFHYSLAPRWVPREGALQIYVGHVIWKGRIESLCTTFVEANLRYDQKPSCTDLAFQLHHIFGCS